MTRQNSLEHYGVKGMKWGVRRPIGPDGLILSKGIKGRVESIKRTQTMVGKGRNPGALTDRELRRYTKRLNLENTMDRLTSKDKTTRDLYRNRGKMTNKDIATINQRLQLEDNLKKEVAKASKTQRELGKYVTKVAGDVVISTAIGQMGGGKVAVGKILAESLVSNLSGDIKIPKSGLASNATEQQIQKYLDDLVKKTNQKMSRYDKKEK